jgi:hypothetical protein
MCDDRPSYAAKYLRSDVMRRFSPRQPALQGIHDRNHGIEMRSGNSAKCENERYKSRARGHGVCEQRQGRVAVCETLGHHTGTDHRSYKKKRSGKFRNAAAPE